MIWSAEETAAVAAGYATATWEELRRALPGRSDEAIRLKGRDLGINRNRYPNATDEERRLRKNARVNASRLRNVDRYNERNRVAYAANKDAIREGQRRYAARRFFWIKIRSLIKHKGATGPFATPREIALLWKRQRGCCALTGRRLDRTAELDHRLARTKGGADTIDNLQWVTFSANRAKREMTMESFVELCRDVVRMADGR